MTIESAGEASNIDGSDANRMQIDRLHAEVQAVTADAARRAAIARQLVVHTQQKLMAENAALEDALRVMSVEHHARGVEIQTLKRTLSWRITRPFRVLSRLATRLMRFGWRRLLRPAMAAPFRTAKPALRSLAKKPVIRKMASVVFSARTPLGRHVRLFIFPVGPDRAAVAARPVSLTERAMLIEAALLASIARKR